MAGLCFQWAKSHSNGWAVSLVCRRVWCSCLEVKSTKWLSLCLSPRIEACLRRSRQAATLLSTKEHSYVYAFAAPHTSKLSLCLRSFCIFSFVAQYVWPPSRVSFATSVGFRTKGLLTQTCIIVPLHLPSLTQKFRIKWLYYPDDVFLLMSVVGTVIEFQSCCPCLPLNDRWTLVFFDQSTRHCH